MLYNKRPLIYIPKKKKAGAPAPAPEPLVAQGVMYGRIPCFNVSHGVGVKINDCVCSICYNLSTHQFDEVMGKHIYDYTATANSQLSVIFLARGRNNDYTANFKDIARGFRWHGSLVWNAGLIHHAYFVGGSGSNIYHIKNLHPVSGNAYGTGMSYSWNEFSYRSTLNNIQYSGLRMFEGYLTAESQYSLDNILDTIQNKLSTAGILPSSGGALMLIGTQGANPPSGWGDASALNLVNYNSAFGLRYWGTRSTVVDLTI